MAAKRRKPTGDGSLDVKAWEAFIDEKSRETLATYHAMGIELEPIEVQKIIKKQLKEVWPVYLQSSFARKLGLDQEWNVQQEAGDDDPGDQ